MKRPIQIAFAISLVLLSIVSTIFPENELMVNIVCSVVVPSFILSFMSFVSEISAYCDNVASRRANTAKEAADLAEETIALGMENYKAGIYEIPYEEGRVPTKFIEWQKQCIEFSNIATASVKVKQFLLKANKVCNYIVIAGYVLLFTSLFLSPYIVRLLSAVNLNCITLWSLTLLYVSLELKSEISYKIFCTLFNRAKKKADAEVNNAEIMVKD